MLCNGASTMSPWQFALAWLLAKPSVTAQIVGATKSDYLEDAVAALFLRLSPEEIAALEEPYSPHPVLGFSSADFPRCEGHFKNLKSRGVGTTREAIVHISPAVCDLDKEIVEMKHPWLSRPFLLGSAALLCGALLVAGCNKPSHPDEKAAVDSAMTSNNLGVVSVSQDRDKGVMTLKGDVESDAKKAQAESVARQAAPDYTIANEIGVRPPQADNAGAVASNLDSGIEDNFKAAIKAHKNLDDQSISGSAKNGTLVVKGTVKTTAQKKEAGELAKKVPNVQQVVNELEVKPGKHSTPKS